MERYQAQCIPTTTYEELFDFYSVFLNLGLNETSFATKFTLMTVSTNDYFQWHPGAWILGFPIYSLSISAANLFIMLAIE